ncbi:MAG: hypothetical protein V7636_2598, partial [Actinomycetota bacterium]
MITVIIPTYERPGLLQDALRSVASQQYRDVEVVVVNDGGRPVDDAVAPWRRSLDIVLMDLPERTGPARARNAAIDVASGDLLAFLDDDDVFLPHHLELLHDALAERPDLDLVYSGALVSDHRLDSVPHDWLQMHRKAYRFDERFLLVTNFIHTGSVLVRNFADSTVRFDESLTHCEDWDLWIALRFDLGLAIEYVDGLSSIYHQVPGTAGLVAQAQTVVPSPFTVVRERLHARWPATDGLVGAYRDWLTEFEQHRNEVIITGQPVPTLLFDRVLRHLFDRFVRGDDPDLGAIPRLFDDGVAPE